MTTLMIQDMLPWIFLIATIAIAARFLAKRK